MVLLIDTNIILDVLLSRSDFVKESSIIWKLCETEQAKGYISTLTYANMMYIMRKQMTPEQIEDVFRKLKLIFEFADFSSVVLEMAVKIFKMPYKVQLLNMFMQTILLRATLKTLRKVRLWHLHLRNFWQEFNCNESNN